MDPPSFNIVEFTIPHLTCSDEDLFWSVKLPPVSAAEKGKVDIALSATKLAKLFILQEGRVLTLKGSTLQDFLRSKECSESDEIDVDFVLSSKVLG